MDWRNRNGWSYVTAVRNQGGCESCWAFAAAALVESMVRIEHGVWCTRSEGDIQKGVGKQCIHTGNMGESSSFMMAEGVADPDCFPYAAPFAVYEAEPRPATGVTHMSSTPDRSGRTVRMPGLTAVTAARDQKKWLQTVGPLIAQMNVHADFGAYSGGVYTPTAGATGASHYVLIVGYNEFQRCWIAKNSWGDRWGEQGFFRIAYGQSGIDAAPKYGLRGTNPDPWTKRRQRNGALIQSGSGAARNNFELFVPIKDRIEHHYRDNAAAGLPWTRVGPLPGPHPAQGVLGLAAAVQSTYNRNYEVVFHRTDGRLSHVYYSQLDHVWRETAHFGRGDTEGVPGFVQSNWNAPGDFEVVVRTVDHHLSHFSRHNGPPWTRDPGEWHDRGLFARGVAHSGPALVQSRLGAGHPRELGEGELHVVCVLDSGEMEHWVYDRAAQGWQSIDRFGSGIDSPPCMIEGTYCAFNERNPGNFELCVAVGGRVQYWSRYNSQSPQSWGLNGTFGSDVEAVVGLLQGSFGFNLELVVLRTDGRYQHYFRDATGWNAGAIIT